MAKTPITIRGRQAEIIRLRIDLGLTFDAIAARVGGTAREAQYVIERWTAGGKVGYSAVSPQPALGPSFTHRWARRRALPERFGQPCRIVNPEAYHFGPTAQVMVEFADGVREVATLGDLRRIEPVPKWRATVEARRRKGTR